MVRYYLLFHLLFIPLDILLIASASTGFVNMEYFNWYNIVITYVVILLMLAIPSALAYYTGTKKDKVNNRWLFALCVGIKATIFFAIMATM